MRVLYVIAMYGAEYLGNLIHRELAHEFLKHGHSFDVFAFGSARKGERSGQAVEQGIAIHRAVTAGTTATDALNALVKPLFHYDRFGAGWWALRRFLAHAEPYDVIIAEGAYPFGALCALASPPGSRLVVTVAGGDFIDSRSARYGYGRFRTARRLMRRTFERAAAVRVTTPLVRERVLALGAPPDKLAFIPRNIGSYCYPPPEMPLASFRAQARDALGARYALDGAHVLVAVGRLLPIKGFDTLLRALPAVIRASGATRLLLAGPSRHDPEVGDYGQYLARLAAELDIGGDVIFTGAIPHPEMRPVLAGSDLIVVPSVLEGMNKVAVEGAAVGTPSIVTRTAGIADLVSNAGCGLVVEPGSPEALAAGIRALLMDPARRAEFSARGVEFARRFASPVIASELVALCERVASDK